MLKVYRLCVSLGWILGLASLLLAIVQKLRVIPMELLLSTTPRGLLDFSICWFLFCVASRSIFELESKQGPLS